jgi:CRP-like cAMP-binding protein
MYRLDRPEGNRLLATLPTAEFDRLLPNLELVTLTHGQVMAESGQTPSHAYFPTTAIVSMLYVMENGDSAEVAVVGNEGVVGISLFLGGDRTPSITIVQNTGHAYRLPSRHLSAEFDRRAAMMRLLLRYTQALVTQMTQSAVCNRHHLLEQQLCRWLLMRLDRLGRDELLVTHEMIANLLGVRREGVTEEAVKLQAAGLLRYKRGKVEVLDRAGLERVVCECFEVVKNEYDRLLPMKTADMHTASQKSYMNEIAHYAHTHPSPLTHEEKT